jgi:uncharacterized protein YegP (UPF0339 family)
MIKLNYETNQAYSFKLKNDKGYTLLKSISFKSEEELKITVSNLKTIINSPSKFERKTNHEGNFLFSLKDDNGKVIGNSKNYNSEAGMENGIKNLKNTLNS